MSLQDSSIHKLRAIAQGLAVSNIFEKDKNELIQEIDIKNKIEAKEKEPPPVVLVVEQKEMPDPNDIVTALEPFIKRGLKVELSNNCWRMKLAGREDSGSLSVPLNVIVRCARALF